LPSLETLHEFEADDVLIEGTHTLEIVDTQCDLPQTTHARLSLLVQRWDLSGL